MNTDPSLLAFLNNRKNLARTAAQLGISKDTLRLHLAQFPDHYNPNERRKGGGKPRKLPLLAPVTNPPQLPTSVDVSSPPTMDTALLDLLQSTRLTFWELCEKLDASPATMRRNLDTLNGKVQTDGERYWIEVPKPEPILSTISADREARKARAEAATLKEKYDALLDRNAELENELDLALNLKAAFNPAKITASPSHSGGQATVIALASDWHVGQRVDSHTVNYLNEFNPTIAEQRAKAFFRNLLTLIRKLRHDVAIKNLVLWLGGDLISNTIHEELLETNYMTPFQEAEFAQNLIAGGLKLLAEDGELEKITIVCNTGNHGRTTKKVHHGSEVNNSYEHAIYWHLRQRFGEAVFDWQIAQGYFQYVEIYGTLHRFHHGHNTKYGGGIGGLTIPLTKFIHRANQQRFAAHDWIGHYHQLFRHPDFTINGSLVGFDSYALSIGARPERPQQALQLIDAKRGFTISAPILLED